MGENTELRFDEINGRIIVKDILQNIPFIVMAGLIFTMLVQIYGNMVQRPVYQSSATLAVTATNTNGGLLASLSTASSMATVYSDIFEDNIIKEKVVDVLGLTEWPSGVSVNASPIKESNLITLRVNADTPKEAYMVIRAILDSYNSISELVFDNASIEVIKNPQVATESSSSFKKGFYSIAAGMLGAIFMIVLVAIFSILRDTVKTVQTAKRHLEGTNLGVITHEKKRKNSGKDSGLLLSNPVMSFGFEESYNQLASKVAYEMHKNQTQIVTITSVAENEGKSTVAVNLAMSLQRRNKKVLLLDLDLLKPALYKFFDYELPEEQGIKAFFDGKKTIKDIMIQDKKTGLSMIMNSKAMDDGQKYLTSEQLGRLIKICSRVFDYIILDTAPLSAGTDAENALNAADASILVVRQDRVSIDDINNEIENLKDSNKKFIGYVLNDFYETDTDSHMRYGSYGRYGKYGEKA